MDFLPALCNVFSSLAILSATFSVFMVSYFCFYDFLIFVRIAFVPASKEAKKAHWIWKNKGKSNSSTVKEKTNMRQVQRQA
jgi:hypothetical protein